MTRHELADAMIRGIATQDVCENDEYYLSVEKTDDSDFCFTCAMGAGLIGKYDGDFKQAEEVFIEAHEVSEFDSLDVLADLLEIPHKFAIEIEHKHLNGMPIQQIAAWLKTSEGGEA